MKCVICKTGTTKQGLVTVTVDVKGTIVVIRDVPAKVCSNCGNYYLSSEITNIITKKVQDAVSKGAEVEIIRINAA